ncbi:hypothetical protein GCM10022393_34100 [Aquimarina addita]|uniref:Uncharacterized protein n=1 Tax=Aquimarina addita TaxID=870485 RepID=A0ABP6UPW4_9FLAO
MKISAIHWVILTTFILITVTMFGAMNIAFSWVFYLTIFGQSLFIYTVYKVLTDDYKTNKKFDNFYEDKPVYRS